MAPEPSKPSRVLVVDDDPSIRALLTTTLTRNGFTVTDAADGFEALEKLEHDSCDLLVLDLMMPRLDGVGVVTKLHESGRPGKRPKVMIVTAASEPVLRNVPTPLVAKIISKPFELPALVEAVRQLCEED